MLYPFLTGFTKPESPLSSRGPSARIWGRMKLNEMLEQGTIIYDDYHSGGGTLAANAVKWDGPLGLKYHFYGSSDAFGSSSCNLVADATDAFPVGELALTVNYDEHEGYLSLEQSVAAALAVMQTNVARVAFEARVKFTNVGSAPDALEKIVGLAALGGAASGTIGSTEIKLAPFVGFRALASSGADMDAVYASSTGVVVHKAASQESKLVIQADVYYKFGVQFDGKKCYWFVDGQQIGAGALPSSTHFPAGAPLVPLIGIKGEGTTADKKAIVDWVLVGAYPL